MANINNPKRNSDEQFNVNLVRRRSSLIDSNQNSESSLKSDEDLDSLIQRFTSISKLLSHKRFKLIQEIESETKNSKYSNQHIDSYCIKDHNQQLTSVEKEQLYCAILYTIIHKIGRTIDGHTDFKEDLLKFVQNVFKITNEDHVKHFEAMSEVKPPLIILNVEVMEARNLEAKDANGLSDPYCMLGIIPAEKFDALNLNEEKSEASLSHHQSMKVSKNKLFSFKKANSHLDQKLQSSTSCNISTNLNKIGAIRDKLPAKFIKTTDVKYCTLNPKWMEKFQFQIEDINKDIFHLDVWDHDDDFSVFEAARKLNEVKSLKGLDRYFKQIAQSARKNKSDENAHVDDFLGCVTVKTVNLPSNGIEKWFDLESRSEKSKVEGQIRLRLNLATREYNGVACDDNWNELNQHEHLICIFIDYEVSKSNDEQWNGTFSCEAETILHQHAIQSDITEFQIALCKWIAFGKKFFEDHIDYNLVIEKIHKLNSIWSKSSISRNENELLKESFDLFKTRSFKFLSNLRNNYHVSYCKNGIDHLQSILNLLREIYQSAAFEFCYSTQTSLLNELLIVLKKDAKEWFEKQIDENINKNKDKALETLIQISESVYLDLYLAKKYSSQIFQKEVDINLFALLYKKFDFELMNFFTKSMSEQFGEVGAKFNPEMNSASVSLSKSSSSLNVSDEFSPNSSNSAFSIFCELDQETAMKFFALYCCLYAISKLRNSDINDNMKFEIEKFYNFFMIPLKKWINLIKVKIQKKIENASLIENNDQLKEPNSLEVCQCFEQIASLWKLINWPDQIGSLIFFNEIVVCINLSVVKHATFIREKIQLVLNPNTIHSKRTSLYNSNNKTEMIVKRQSNHHIQFNSNDHVTNKNQTEFFENTLKPINDIERIRVSLCSFMSSIDFHRVKSDDDILDENRLMEKNASKNEIILNNTIDYLVQTIEKIIEVIVEKKILVDIDSHIFYLFESPESASAYEALSRIIQYLEANIKSCKSLACTENLNRLIKQIWIKLLVLIDIKLKADDEIRSINFYAKMSESLDILANFLNTSYKSSDNLISFEIYKELKKYFKLQSIDTPHLIQMYYHEMANFQKNLNQGDLGEFLSRAYYDSTDETLIVEVFRCKNLVACDDNGFSDPYIDIELKPSWVFPNYEKKTTSVIKKTLNPIYNEIFEFKIPEKLCFQNGNVLHFTVMDHDVIWTNDFEGEAFIEISSLPGVHSRHEIADGAYKDLKYTHLFLMKSKNFPSKIIEVLAKRLQDKLAVEFLRTRKD